MPKRPKGEKRPADGIGKAVRVVVIATGQRGPYRKRGAKISN